MKKLLFCLLVLFQVFAFSAQTLCVYAKAKANSKVRGELQLADSIEELPIPKKKVKKVSYKRDKKTKKKKKVVRYVEVEPKEPPEFVPVKTKFGKGYVRRAYLARFKEKAADLSGAYFSATGVVILEKSPNSPGKFNLIIQNGTPEARAEIAAGNLQIANTGERHRLQYKEPGCTIDVDLHERKIRVAQTGCEEYNVGKTTLAGYYDRYEERKRRAESFAEPEQKLKFKKFLWCPAGMGSCEKIRDEEDCTVEIVWSAGGQGMIERRCDEQIHKYRPFERMIPNKKDFFEGEKPTVWKTKRTDMSNEWMIWYYYPKAERFKMVRSGSRTDGAYTEIYE